MKNNDEKKTYIKPKITTYGNLEEITKSTRYPGTGDLIYALVSTPGTGFGS